MIKTIIVNEKDEIIGHKEREKVTKEDIYRVSALWVKNSKGEVLLAQRALTKTHHPGKWGPAVAGTVDERETYEENMIKEAEEELGLKDIKLQLGPKTRTSNDWNHFTQWFILTIDKSIEEFKVEEEEVEAIKWWKIEELKLEMQEHPEKFLKDMPKYLNLFCT